MFARRVPGSLDFNVRIVVGMECAKRRRLVESLTKHVLHKDLSYYYDR
jgi:hypothetical protein